MLGFLYKNVVQNEIYLFPTLDKALQKAYEEWEYKHYSAEDIRVIYTNTFRIDRVNIPLEWNTGNPLFVRYPNPTITLTSVKFSETIEPSHVHL